MIMNERSVCMNRSRMNASFAAERSNKSPRMIGRISDEMVRTEKRIAVRLAFASLARRPAPARAAATSPPPMRIDIKPVIRVTSTNVLRTVSSQTISGVKNMVLNMRNV